MRSIVTSCLAGASLLAISATGLTAESKEHPINFDIYGVAHVSVDSIDDGQDTSLYMSSNSSRLGFKGDWELNDVLKAIWQVECDASLDESGGEFASRNSFAGLSSDKGTFLFGRHDSAFEVLSDQVCLFRDQIGDARNIIGNQGAGWNQRVNNVIAYQSPDVGGLSAFLIYTPEDGSDKGDLASASVSYRKGGLFLSVAGESHGKGLTATTSDSYMTVSTTLDPVTGQALIVEQPAVTTLSDKNETGFRAAGSYSISNIRLTALYEALNDVGGVSGADSSAWGAGAAYTIDKHVLKGQYYSADGLDGIDDGSSMIAVGYDYNLTANTRLYAAYAATDNDPDAGSSMSTAGRGDSGEPAIGDDPSGVSLGLVHKF